MSKMIDVAINAVKAGGDLAYRYFKTQLKVSYKPDNSPVTKADIETEKLIRKIIAKKFPDHGIIGEELPPINPKAKYQWVIDPIDGTRDFIRKIPYWAVFIAVLENNKPTIGIVHFPVQDLLISAQKGKGVVFGKKKVSLSKTKQIEKARINVGSIKRYLKNKTYEKSLLRIAKAAEASRSYGNLAFIYLLEGKIDAMIEPYGLIHDYAAPSLIIEEAGGKFTDFSGEFSLTNDTAVFSNGLLHNQVLKILNF